MTDISICICTRNRQEGLKLLLDSLMKMQTPPDVKVKIVVVENDLESYSEEIVKEFSLKCEFRISYFLETRLGLAHARNRSVREANESDFCCFVDDDQAVAVDWLVELIKCQNEFNADGVYGRNPPVFNKQEPLYIKKFHNAATYNYGTIINSAYTNCLLLRKKYLDKIDGPFDIRLNFTGGEDVYLTRLITNMGGVIRFNPNAIAYEIIPESRTTIKYIFKRTYRISNAGLFIKSIINENKTSWNAFPRLTMRLGLGILIALPFLLFGKSNKLLGVMKIADALGGILFILGSKTTFYK